MRSPDHSNILRFTHYMYVMLMNTTKYEQLEKLGNKCFPWKWISDEKFFLITCFISSCANYNKTCDNMLSHMSFSIFLVISFLLAIKSLVTLVKVRSLRQGEKSRLVELAKLAEILWSAGATSGITSGATMVSTGAATWRWNVTLHWQGRRNRFADR